VADTVNASQKQPGVIRLTVDPGPRWGFRPGVAVTIGRGDELYVITATGHDWIDVKRA
jgi:hypothetical protein